MSYQFTNTKSLFIFPHCMLWSVKQLCFEFLTLDDVNEIIVLLQAAAVDVNFGSVVCLCSQKKLSKTISN